MMLRSVGFSSGRIIVFRILALSVLFFLWQQTQVFISVYKSTVPAWGDIHDQLFVMTSSVNHYLNDHPHVSRWLLSLMSFEIDVLTLFLFIYSALSKSARWVIGLFLLMSLRQFAQVMVLLKSPAGMIWYDTHIPTLFVTYQVANDFFFSGHTALVVYAGLTIGRIFNRVPGMVFLKWGAIIFQIAGIIVLRVHYFMDIYAAIMTALVIYHYTASLPLPGWLETPADILPYDNSSMICKIR